MLLPTNPGTVHQPVEQRNNLGRTLALVGHLCMPRAVVPQAQRDAARRSRVPDQPRQQRAQAGQYAGLVVCQADGQILPQIAGHTQLVPVAAHQGRTSEPATWNGAQHIRRSVATKAAARRGGASALPARPTRPFRVRSFHFCSTSGRMQPTLARLQLVASKRPASCPAPLDAQLTVRQVQVSPRSEAGGSRQGLECPPVRSTGLAYFSNRGSTHRKAFECSCVTRRDITCWTEWCANSRVSNIRDPPPFRLPGGSGACYRLPQISHSSRHSAPWIPFSRVRWKEQLGTRVSYCLWFRTPPVCRVALAGACLDPPTRSPTNQRTNSKTTGDVLEKADEDGTTEFHVLRAQPNSCCMQGEAIPRRAPAPWSRSVQRNVMCIGTACDCAHRHSCMKVGVVYVPP